MMSSRFAWRIAAVAAFAATATLAVTLSRGAPVDASFVSARQGISAHQGISATHEASGPRCAMSRLRIRVNGDERTLRYAVEFTNVSAGKCTLTGYPSVSAYSTADGQVGKAAGRDPSAAVSPVVLAPGASADARVIASPATFPNSRCHPVTADGLRIVAPGETDGRDVRHMLPACSATGRQAPVFLRVLAVQPEPGTVLPG